MPFFPLLAAVVLLCGCSDSGTDDTPEPAPKTPAAAAPNVVPEPAPEQPANGFRIVKRGQSWGFEKNGVFFASLGVSVVHPREGAPRDPAKAYDGLAAFNGNRALWASAMAARLGSWGFNTIGAWSDDAANSAGLPYTRVVWLGGQSGHGQREDTRLVDVFAPEFAERVERQAVSEVAPHAGDEALIGFFVNNELPFYGEFGWPTDPDKSLWDRYLRLPQGALGRNAAVEFFLSRYGDGGKATLDWGVGEPGEVRTAVHLEARTLDALRFKHEWAGVVADRYFEICCAAVRRHAPGKLVLGSRHAGRPPAAVARAEAKHTDAVSINHYRPEGDPDLGMLRSLHALTGKPVLITEFSWRAVANRSGNTNAKGAEVTVPTQTDRADRYRSFVGAWMTEPYALGAHWFQFHDQPADGRAFDGENSNYGIVDTADRPYEELVAAMTETNRAVLAGVENRWAPQEGYAFDPEAWGELLPTRVDGGSMAAPVRLDLPSRPLVVKADTGCSGRAEVRPEGILLSYQSGGGWGLHADLALPPGAFSGAASLRLAVRGPLGKRFRVFLSESGDGPPGRQTYQGYSGADGESFEYAAFTASGGRQEITIPLESAGLRQYWGNQRGDRRLSTADLGTLSIFVFPNQGGGEFLLESAEFLPPTTPAQQ